MTRVGSQRHSKEKKTREAIDKQVSSPRHGDDSGNVQDVYLFVISVVDKG
jgi:hypothetical protein